MIKEFLSKYGIDCVGAIPLSRCKITKQYLLDRSSLDEHSSVIMDPPYTTDFGIMSSRSRISMPR